MNGLCGLPRCSFGARGEVVSFYAPRRTAWFRRFFFFSSRRRHTRWNCDWSSHVCSSDLVGVALVAEGDQADLQLRRRLAVGDLVADGPDLLLGALDQAAHAAGRVQDEDDLDLRLAGLGRLDRKSVV